MLTRGGGGGGMQHILTQKLLKWAAVFNIWVFRDQIVAQSIICVKKLVFICVHKVRKYNHHGKHVKIIFNNICCLIMGNIL
jgi:hypothetical protein